MSTETHAEETHRQQHAPKTYVVVFLWLAAITLLEIFIAFMPIEKALMAMFFIVLALLKVGLIGGFFMHLIYERINLIYSILLPLILLAVLVVGVLPDALSVLMLRMGSG